jgi:M6 family metalloprotease-like protein
MHARLFCVAVALAFAGSACEPGVVAQPNDGKGFSPVAMVPHLVKELRAQGKQVKVPFPATASRAKKFNPSGGPLGPLETAAEQKVLVLFANFTTPPPGGPAAPRDLADYDDLLFGTTYDPPEWQMLRQYGVDYPTDLTLVNFYREVTYGKVDITTVDMPSTRGWTNVGKPYDYYCKADGVHDNAFGFFPNNAQGLVIDVIEAAKAAHPDLNFANYANANGVIPNLFVVFRGTGAEWSGTGELIWSHSWDLSEGTGLNGYTVDGVRVNNYAMMPEVGGDLTGFYRKSGPFAPNVGVFAHEYGHVLGLPDLYDYGYESEGVGGFSLMAGGSWNTYPAYLNFLGNAPAHPDAWNKIRLGVVTPIEITATTDVSLPPVVEEPVIYKLPVPGSNGAEYYLLENRQQVGFDVGFALQESAWNAGLVHGLAVYHVDDTVMQRSYWRCNEAENWKENRFASAQKNPYNGEQHYGVSLLQADGLWQLERGASSGDDGDLYPGTRGVHRLGDTTSPNTTTYYFYGNDPGRWGHSGISLENIQEAGGYITTQIRFQ